MPKPPDLKKFRIRSGTLFDNNQGLLLTSHNELTQDKVPHTFAFMWRRKGEWSGRQFSWTSGSVCYVPAPIPQGVAIGEDGEFFCWGVGQETEGRISEGGIYSSVNRVGDFAYVVGMSAKVCKHTYTGSWEIIDTNLPRDVDFEAIAGFSTEEMYAVGWRGDICIISPLKADRIPSMTNLILTNVCCGADGLVYCCGQKGILLRGRRHKWELIDHGDTNEDLWDVHWFQGKLYISSLSFLYTLEEGDNLKHVRFGDDTPSTFYHLSSVKDLYLWSIGDRDVMGFDGTKWERIL